MTTIKIYNADDIKKILELALEDNDEKIIEERILFNLLSNFAEEWTIDETKGNPYFTGVKDKIINIKPGKEINKDTVPKISGLK